MKISIKLMLFAILVFLFAPLSFGVGPTEYDFYFDTCTDDKGTGGTDISAIALTCENGSCTARVDLCGDVDTKAKYRLHFDTTGPFFDDVSDCTTTSDDTGMYRPRSTTTNDGKLTGPAASGSTQLGDAYLRWVYPYESLGVSEGSYLAAWLDIQKKGIADRAPDTYTGGADDCAKPQAVGEVLEVCAGGTCN